MTFKNQVPLPRDYVLEVKVLLDFSIREWYISYSTVSPLTTGDSWDLLKSNYSANYAKYCGSAFPDTSIISGCSLKVSALRFLKTGNYNRRKTYHLLIFGKEHYMTNYIYMDMSTAEHKHWAVFCKIYLIPSGSCLQDKASSRSLAVDGSMVKMHSFLSKKKKKRKIYLPVMKKASKHIDQRHPDNNNNVFRRLRLLKHLPN